METTTNSVTVELSAEQYAFLTSWQKQHESELGMEIPISAMVRKAVDGAMKAYAKREECPARDDRPPRKSFGDKPPFKKSFGNAPSRGKPFGARPAGRGPKFDMLGAKNKTRKLDK